MGPESAGEAEMPIVNSVANQQLVHSDLVDYLAQEIVQSTVGKFGIRRLGPPMVSENQQIVFRG